MHTQDHVPADSRDLHKTEDRGAGKPYAKLALAVTLNFLIMFALTFSGVNAWNEIFVNLNRFYMAVIMVSAMVPVMVLVMWKMFSKPAWNVGILDRIDD